MKAIIQALLMAFLGFSLTHCKQIQFDAEGNVVVTGVDEGTEVQTIEYYQGGGLRPAPGYDVDLVMSLRDNGTVKMLIDRPACQISKITDSRDFLELADLIEFSKKRRFYGPSPLDIGRQTVSVFDVNGQRRDYQLSPGEGIIEVQLILEDQAIRTKLNKILEQYPCDRVVVPGPICANDSEWPCYDTWVDRAE